MMNNKHIVDYLEILCSFIIGAFLFPLIQKVCKRFASILNCKTCERSEQQVTTSNNALSDEEFPTRIKEPNNDITIEEVRGDVEVFLIDDEEQHTLDINLLIPNSQYEAIFLKPKKLKSRQCVYIGGDLHLKIIKIVNEIAMKEMTVGAFIDTIIREHLEEHKNEINHLYRRKRDNLL